MSKLPKLLALLAAFSTGCAQQIGGGAPIDDQEDCTNCDTLGEVDPVRVCETRKRDLTNGEAFGADSIRWSCADVAGINTFNKDDRGTEYCEYFAYVMPGAVYPDFGDGVGIFGKITAKREKIALSFEEVFGIDLSTDDLGFDFEDNPDTIVGQCVFTAWNGDDALESCNSTDCTTKLDVNGSVVESGVGLDVTFDQLSLSDPLNRTDSARELIDDCGVNRSDKSSIIESSCQSLEDMNRFEQPNTRWLPYSKGNAALCSAASSLETCGCEATEGTMAEALIPSDSLKLETWEPGKLPAHCKAEADSSVVTCDITAWDVMQSQGDVKNFCREAYGHNIVVRVPVPETSCSADEIAACGAWAE